MKKRWPLLAIILCVNICCGLAWFILSWHLFEITKAYASIPAQKQALEDARYLWETTAQDQQYIVDVENIDEEYYVQFIACHREGRYNYLVDGDGLADDMTPDDYCDDFYHHLGMRALFDRIAADLKAGPTQVEILRIEYDPTYGYVRYYETDNWVCRRRSLLFPANCINEFSIIEYQP